MEEEYFLEKKVAYYKELVEITDDAIPYTEQQAQDLAKQRIYYASRLQDFHLRLVEARKNNAKKKET